MTVQPVGVSVTSSVFGGGEKYLVDLYGNSRLRDEFEATLLGSMPGWETTGLTARTLGQGQKWSRRGLAGSVIALPLSMARGRHGLAEFSAQERPAFFHFQYKREQILFTASAARRSPVLWTEHGRLPRFGLWKAVAPAYRRAARQASAIVCVTAGVADDIDALLGPGGPTVHVIENSVDLARFKPPGAEERSAARATLDVPSDSLVLASVCRVSESKRLRLLIDAAASIPGAIALVCGDGPDRPALQAHAAGTGARFTGFVDDPGTVYRAADVLVHPTSGEGEGLPLALLEAAACGLPAVVCNDSGLAPLVAGWGSIATGPTAAGVAAAVLATRSPDRCAAARRWAGHHSLDGWVAAHLEVMRSIAAAPPAHRRSPLFDQP